MGGRIDSLCKEVTVMSMGFGLFALVGLGGCAVAIGVVVLVVWAVADNAKKKKDA
jgi:putative flippase GtrA